MSQEDIELELPFGISYQIVVLIKRVIIVNDNKIVTLGFFFQFKFIALPSSDFCYPESLCTVIARATFQVIFLLHIISY